MLARRTDGGSGIVVPTGRGKLNVTAWIVPDGDAMRARVRSNADAWAETTPSSRSPLVNGIATSMKAVRPKEASPTPFGPERNATIPCTHAKLRNTHAVPPNGSVCPLLTLQTR